VFAWGIVSKRAIEVNCSTLLGRSSFDTRTQTPKMRVPHLAFLVAAILTMMFSAQRVSADFSGPYTFAPDDGLYTPSNLPSGSFTMSVGTWTLSGAISPNWENNYMIAHADEFRFDTGGSKMDGNFNENISLTHIIAASGLLSFDYSVSFIQPNSQFSGDVAGYTINGQLTFLPEGTGSVAIAVSQGDMFGFYLAAGPQCVTCQPAWSSGTALDVTNFVAPVPEPSTFALLVCAAAGAMAAKGRLR
jgi:hypothetical protein